MQWRYIQRRNLPSATNHLHSLQKVPFLLYKMYDFEYLLLLTDRLFIRNPSTNNPLELASHALQ